jgi:AbrB family looped-hinge helix DNA binding protein
MTLTIDGAGRIVLPKPVRERLGLNAGSNLEIEEVPEGVILKPTGRGSSLIRKGTFLIHTGELPPGYDLLKAIEQDRDERDRKTWGQ